MAVPNSRDTLIEYCLRKLGDPVIEINVDPDQLEDRVDEALQLYQEFHSDATYKAFLKHQITADDIANGYVPISSDVMFVSRLFPVDQSSVGSGMFSIKYQMFLNDMAHMASFVGELSYYEQMMQYVSLLEHRLTGTPQIEFARQQDRLYIFGEFESKDIKEGDYILAEVLQIVNPDSFTSVYNDMWLKEYTTQLIKQQWGANLIKFEGMQLPGGVTINGRQLFDDATAEIERLRERLRLEQELPPDFFVG